MYKSNLHLRNNKGQILVEAVVVSLLMVVIMLAFQKIVELKNSQTKHFETVYKKVESLNFSILSLRDKLYKTKEVENTLIYSSKLSQEEAKKKKFLYELNSFKKQANYWQKYTYA